MIPGDDVLNTIYYFGGMWCVFLSGSTVLRPNYVVVWTVFVVLFTLILLPKINDSLEIPSVKNQIIMYGLYLFCCVISIVVSTDRDKSLVFTERLALAILYAIGVSSNDNNFLRQQRILELFLFFLLGVSFIELFFPEIYQSVFLPLLDGQQGYYLRIGTYGLCIQGFAVGISKNGLWMSIGFVLYLSKFVSGDRKIKNIILLLLYFIMIFCTGKRSYSLIAIVLLLWGAFLMNRGQHFGRRLAITLLLFVGLGIGAILLSKRIPAFSTSIVRSLEFLEDGDISDGRFDAYASAIASIPSNPFGIGIDVSGLHNSYLQFILELGWIGGTLSICLFISPFIMGMKRLKSVLSLGVLSEVDNRELLFSMFFQALILLAGFVALPFLWHDVIMLFMISQIAMLRKYNKYYEAITNNIGRQSINGVKSKYIK